MNPKDIPPHDSYTAFLARLDAATANLSKRAVSLDKALAAVSLLLGPYESAVRTWERRRAQVGMELARQSGNPQTAATLNELHDMAVNMESALRDRALRVSEKLSVMQ
ncbi:hypothetical protein [Arthrobacter sp. CJ23]|uniref:hypothetical protein n=1 Tax=Arthrobacter sp. CJ23 TaxID=2972479 RepID=UPI00215BB197|nr:hypothetical protein [Arthrobacter sp. CJ23]UVJ40374.1 hypothetical protein NVV90_04120 [Arthrobacter sp. CJ23]